MAFNWLRSDNMRSALLTGGLGIVAAAIGGFVQSRKPNPEPVPSRPTPPVAVVEPGPTLIPRSSKEVSAPALEISEPRLVMEPEPSIHELVNNSVISLAKWQAMVLDLSVDAETRAKRFLEYNGHVVTWEGYVAGVHPIQYDPTPARSFSVIIYESVDSVIQDEVNGATGKLGVPFIRCFFPASVQEDLAKLKRGQRVIIQGTLANPQLNGSLLCTDLSLCKLLVAETELVATSPDDTVTK